MTSQTNRATAPEEFSRKRKTVSGQLVVEEDGDEAEDDRARGSPPCGTPRALVRANAFGASPRSPSEKAIREAV